MKSNFSQISLIAGLLVLLVTIPFGVYIASQQNRPQILKSRAGSDEGLILYLWPANFEVPQCADLANINNCVKTKIEVSLKNDGRVSLGGSDIVLKYDTKAVKIFNDRIYPGAVNENLENVYKIFDYYREGEVDTVNGLIKIKARGKYEGIQGTVASLFVVGLTPGVSKIEFLSDGIMQGGVKVFDQSEQNDILSGTIGAEVTVK